MALKRPPIVITWGEKEYTTKVTMGFIDELDEAVNIMKLTDRMSRGDVRLSHAAKMLYVCLKHAGFTGAQDEVFDAAFDGEHGAKAIVEACGVILQAVFPQPKKATRQRKATKKK